MFRQNKTSLVLIAVFGIIGVAALIGVRAASGQNGVSVNTRETSGVAVQSDQQAYGNDFLLFKGQGTGNADGKLASRQDFPIRNQTLDARTQQYLNVASVNIPDSAIITNQTTDKATRARGCSRGTCLGQFRTQCQFSHFGYTDPVVLPGQKDAAHLHTFFGNTLTNENSNYGSVLNNGSSSCNGFEGNRTAYWVPTLFDSQGNARVPEFFEVYYKSHSGGSDASNLRNTNPFPEAFSMVAGNASDGNKSPFVSKSAFVYWGCLNGLDTAQGGSKSIEIPSCSTDRVFAHIQFPHCIADGFDASKANNTSDVQYPNPAPGSFGNFWTGNCPSGTFKVPAVEYFVVYKIDGTGGDTSNWWLSSDVMKSRPNGQTSHGDWLGGWKRDLFDTVMTNCITIVADCHWNLIDDNLQLQVQTHFGATPGLPTKYSGREISQKLCPGDTYQNMKDTAMCMNKALSSQDAIDYYGLDSTSQDGYVSGAVDDNN